MTTRKSHESVQHFLDIFGDKVSQPDDRTKIEEAAFDPHYGFVLTDNLDAAVNLAVDESETLPVDVIPSALGTLATLLTQSGMNYRYSGVSMDSSSDDWRNHVNNVRDGRIALLPEENWMPTRESTVQSRDANMELMSTTTEVQHVLAVLNYETYFNAKTMAGASQTLNHGPEIAATVSELDAMPHLTVTNWALAQAVQHMYEGMGRQQKGQLHVIDMCSGTGATLAAITNRLWLANQRGNGLEEGRLSITGIEATPAFYEQLTTDYLEGAKDALKALEVNGIALSNLKESDPDMVANQIKLIEGDVVEGIKQTHIAGTSEDDVVVGTVNYGFHRLPSNRKTRIMRQFAKAENALICVGDLRQNGSNVNRGYFNLSNNGPLNAGNILLEELFKLNGYRTYTIGVDGYEPSFVDSALRERLKTELDNDGFVTFAVKGDKAEKLLQQAA